MSDEKKKRGRKVKPADTKTTSPVKRRGRKTKKERDVDMVTTKTVDITRHLKVKTNQPKEKDYTVGETSPPDSQSENVILHLSVHTKDIENPSQANNTGEIKPSDHEVDGLGTHASWVGNDGNTNNMDGPQFASYPFNRDNEIMEMLDDGKQTLMIPSDRESEWKVRGGYKVDHLHNWNDPLKHNDYQTTVNDLCTDHYKELNISGNFEYHNKVDKLLKQFMAANSRNEWPESTPIYCWWCCFPFTGRPCALPTDFDGTTFKVYGCFCCPECAAAYNFNDCQDVEKKWDRFGLLNTLYRKPDHSAIKLAPRRQSLNIFGGPLNIKQFRAVNGDYEKTYQLNFRPMSSIHIQQEQVTLENNYGYKKESEVYIPVDQDRLSEASDALKLKRRRPISSAKNTLESCMNLQFK